MQALRQLVAWQESEGKHSLVKEVKELVTGLVAEIPQAGQTPRPSLLPLEVSAKKKASQVKVQAAPAPAEASQQAKEGNIPSQPKVKPPTPTWLPSSSRLDTKTCGEQKPLIATNQTLRHRPRHECLKNYDLDLAITQLTEALDFATPKSESIGSLTALRNQIDQLLSRLTP